MALPPGGIRAYLRESAWRRERIATNLPIISCSIKELRQGPVARNVPPSASALMSSLRGVGYSLEAAIADIIDNSIAADASRIEIGLDWNGGEPTRPPP